MAADDVSIAVYLDTDDETLITDVLRRVDIVRSLAGYGGPERDVVVVRGSIFRRSWASLRRRLSARETRERLEKLERALEMAVVDHRQAEYDGVEARAVHGLIESLHDVPRACVRTGSLFLVKFQTQAGDPVIVARTLTQKEIRAIERFPEIQTKPESALAALSHAVEQIESLTLLDSSSPPVSGYGSTWH